MSGPDPSENYTIGWICVLAKEQTAAIMMLDKVHGDICKKSNDPNSYTLGSIGQHNVVIACLPLNRGRSHTVATIAVWLTSTFPSIRLCMLVGIGSGIPPKVRLGDVVAGVEWQLGEHKAHEKTAKTSHPPSILLSALTKLESLHEMYGSKVSEYLIKVRENERLAQKYLVSDALRDPLFEEDHEKIGEKHANSAAASDVNDSLWRMGFAQNTNPEPREPRIHYGLIASSGSSVEDKATRDNLDSIHGSRRLLCIDKVVSDLADDFPCIVIRGICDYADERRRDCKGWEEPAAAVSAAFAKEVLSVLLEVEVAGLPTIKSRGSDIRSSDFQLDFFFD
ncbi:nucleoside phosphorylase domain-containing protein [Hypoxylon rubiginosum]|uniref:Nucleoside phosphorylase domain-containing protein n=1 Tax=Hypoxylon rubiginosum TaxID=110542 RepID=A0ACC0DC38_9PEZI|nr:nucleoside phosphorylase domain-containing protein [Hypoxylon rubiginosum]